MNELTEIYVAVKDPDHIEAQIDALCQKYHSQSEANSKLRRALFKSYCHDTTKVFDDCFETTLLGMTRCKTKVKTYETMDNIDIDMATFHIVNMLLNLKGIVKSMIPIKDLPSCKKLTEMSAEDIVAKAKDLVKNDIVKADVGILLLGSKIHDVVHIEDVRNYYTGCLNQLNSEIQIKKQPISSIEQFLLDKFNAEIGYCSLALIKAGINITKEMKDLAEISKKHADKFEHYQSVYNENIVFYNS